MSNASLYKNKNLYTKSSKHKVIKVIAFDNWMLLSAKCLFEKRVCVLQKLAGP